MSGKLADAEVAENEVELAEEGEAAAPDVHSSLAPQLHRPTRPPMLLLAVRKKTGWKLHSQQAFIRMF